MMVLSQKRSLEDSVYFLFFTLQMSCCVQVKSICAQKERTITSHVKCTTTELYMVIKYLIAPGSSNCLMIKLVYITWALSGGGVYTAIFS